MAALSVMAQMSSLFCVPNLIDEQQQEVSALYTLFPLPCLKASFAFSLADHIVMMPHSCPLLFILIHYINGTGPAS